jgi:thermitase
MGLLLTQAGVGIDRYIPELGIYVMTPVAPKLDWTILNRLAQSGEVEWAEKDEMRWSINDGAGDKMAPRDPMYKDQYALTQIEATKAWETSTGSEKVLVAVSDTGVDLNHPDLKNQIAAGGYDFVKNNDNPQDENGHGTHVAGIIGAEMNDVGTVGVNWKVKILPVRFLNAQGSGSDSGGVDTILHSVKMGARVINASWGSTSSSKAIEEAVKFAFSKGTVLIAAAGNDSQDADRTRHYPSDVAPVSVAASQLGSTRASFSNYGATAVHVAAPGHNILSSFLGGGWKKLSGTSMATPVVSGVAALMLSVAPELSAVDLRNGIYNAIYVRPGFTGSVATDGEISAAKAVQQLQAGFQVWPSRLRMKAGEKFQLTAYRPSGEVTWSASDSQVAQVSNGGEITAIAPGKIDLSAVDKAGTKVVAQIEIVKAAGGGRGPVGCFPGRGGGKWTPFEVATSAVNMGLPLMMGGLLMLFGRRRRKDS